MSLPIQNKTYPLPADHTLFLGKAHPGAGNGGGSSAFTLAPGQAKSIHMNTLTSIDPDPNKLAWYAGSSGINGQWNNWNGAIFAPDYSPLGAMVFWGGGHLGYDSTAPSLFNLSTQKWEMIGTPIPYDFKASTDLQWCDVPYQDQFVPPASHPYSSPCYISPAAGGGPKGSLGLMYNVYGGGPGEGAGGSGTGYAPHVCDLATGKWSRYTANGRQYVLDQYAAHSVGYPTSNYGNVFEDVHGVLQCIVGGSTSAQFRIDTKQTVKNLEFFFGPYTPSFYWQACYVGEQEFLLSSYINYMANGAARPAGFVIYDMTTTGNGAWDSYPTHTNAPMMTGAGGFGFDYCPDTNKFYAYAGLGDQVVHVLTPPGPLANARAAGSGNWKTGTWAWSTETNTGEPFVNILTVNSGSQGGQPFSKWKYHRGLKAFMWSQGKCTGTSPDGVVRDGAFQLYRPLGITG